MIVTFTDFGPAGPYTAQMHAAIRRLAPSVPILDLLSDAPSCNPRAAAYLLAALAPQFPRASVFVGVVDPGVGTDRQAVIMTSGERWFVGPDNGLFELAARRGGHAHWWRLDADAASLSASFHGRDLFAPTAARLVTGQGHDGEPTNPLLLDWPDDLAEIIYVDHYGNAMTGLRAQSLAPDASLVVNGRTLPRARTFAEADGLFCYENSIGLLEIALPNGSAAHETGLAVGDCVTVSSRG